MPAVQSNLVKVIVVLAPLKRDNFVHVSYNTESTLKLHQNSVRYLI